MHKFLFATAASLAFLTSECTISAAEPAPDNPDSKIFQEHIRSNRAKVEALAKGVKDPSGVFYFAVEPMSEIMRLEDVFPADGKFNSTLRAVAARGEYEPVSFQLFSLKDRKDVTLAASGLRSKEGSAIPAENVDLKVVKIWYQNGNRWNSYFTDVGLRLSPELLLKDENMIRVDTKQTANYARITGKNGRTKEVWISAPKDLDGGFDALQDGFEDTEKLQNFVLRKNRFKQFFATIHVPENQRAGLYSGTISVRADGKEVLAIPLKVRVLPFALPLPGAYQNIDRPVLCSIMGGFGSNPFGNSTEGRKKFRRMLANAKAHNLLHPVLESTAENLRLLKDMGFPTDPLISSYRIPWFARNFGGRLNFDNMMSAKKTAEEMHKFFMDTLGHNNILITYGDEQGAAFVICHRRFHPYFEQYGIRIGCAGHSPLFYKGAHVYGWHPMGGPPDAHERIKRWRDMGDKYIGFYACQHTGGENPAFIRRQNGMLGYLNGLDMIFNYEFAYGPWNDRANVLYKPMVVAYLNHGGLVDTLQWEGYREAVDDIRYATLLQQEIRAAIRSGNATRKIEAGKALRFFALLQADDANLSGVRAEMIQYILNLQSLASRKG